MLINQPVGVGGIKKVRGEEGGLDYADPIANYVKFVKDKTLNEF